MTSPPPKNRVLMIALDGGEPSLVERWTDEGRLPTLARLRRAGGTAGSGRALFWLAGSIWPTFHTGTLPGDHGHHHFIQWHRERMTLLRPTSDWLPQRVFWRDAAAAGRQVVAVDLPSYYGPEPFNDVEVSGWCNTEDCDRDDAQPGEPGDARRAAEVVLNPRVSCDGLPQKLVNYLASGKPVVSFAGPAKHLVNGENALVVADNDTRAFATAIVRLLADVALASRLGEAGQKLVRRTLSWSGAAERVEDVYDGLP